MKTYGTIDNFRLVDIKVYLNDKDVIYEGKVEDAPEEIKKMSYSKINIDNIVNIYVYDENYIEKENKEDEF